MSEYQRGYIDRMRGVSADPCGGHAYQSGYMDRMMEERGNRQQLEQRG